MNTTEELIVLRTVKFGDSGMVVQLLTENSGKEGLLFRGVGKSNKTNAFAYLHPLSILEAEVTHSKSGSLGYLKSFHPKYRLNSLRSNAIKANIALFMCELINKTIHEGQGDSRLYSYIRDSIVLLDSMESDYSNYHLLFIVRLASLLGFQPENNYSPINNLFDIERAVFVSLGHKSDYSLSTDDSEVLHLILSNDITDVMAIKLSGEKRFSFINSFIKYLEHHLDYKLNLKSHLVLNEIIHSD